MEEAIIKAHKFIDEHLSDEFTLDELARFAGYSSYHFARKFKEVTGKSVMEYVSKKRVLAAANRLY